MAIPRLYAPDNLNRVRYAQMALGLVTLGISGYMVAVTLFSLQDVWQVRSSLRASKTESAELSRDQTTTQQSEARRPSADNGGIATFAVQMSTWARSRNVFIESFSPEGQSVPTEIKSGETNLGMWMASKVTVRGQGDFHQLLSLIDEFRRTRAPVRIEAFRLQSAQSQKQVAVNFELTLTVYEKKSGAS